MTLENQQDFPEEVRPSSSKNDPNDLELIHLKELMSNGKRHYVCNEPRLALDCFVELCEKLADIYGQTGDECAEAYLYYGKTLLEMARVENGVLGNAVKDAPVLGDSEDAVADGEQEEEENKKKDLSIEEDPEDITSEKRAELRANVEHALREGNLYNDTLSEDEQAEEEKEGIDHQEESESEKISPEVTNIPEQQNDGEEDVNETAEEITEESNDCEAGSDDEEVTNMQLSWEMFELCCLICNRIISSGARNVSEAKSFLAEAKYGLAQISLESERYEEAVVDFQACLELYNEILSDKEDRKIAEVYYNIGLALSFDKKFAEAIKSFEQAVSVLEARVKVLENKVNELEENGGKEKASHLLEEYKKEIIELKDLVLLDMMAKIEDAQEMKKQGEASIDAVKQFAKEMFSGISSGFEEGFDQGFDKGFDKSTSSVKDVVNDIGFKVRSLKRKSEDEFPAIEVKKLKQSNGITE